MRENAGNQYQEKSIGTDFSVQLIATQLNYESDSFDKECDKESSFPLGESTQTVTQYTTNTTYNKNVTMAADDWSW